MKVGIIGASLARAAYLPALRHTPGAEVVALASARMSSAQRAADEFDIPHAYDDWEAMLDAHEASVPVVWVQEEPENMGAWGWLRMRYLDRMHGHPFRGVFREASASPATGSQNAHRQEQAQLLSEAFDG